MAFQKATRETTRLRMSLQGPSGSGKTYTALLIAETLAAGRVAVIDTEHGSAALYADRFDFDTVELKAPFTPTAYINSMFEAADAGYTTLVIDSLSHVWFGSGGLLEMVDAEVARSKSGNSFQAWGKVTPEYQRIVQKVLAYPGHVLFTLRSKTDWVLETNAQGKNVPRKIGLAPVMREGIDYEVSIACELDQEHTLVVAKSRFEELADVVVHKPGREFALSVAACLRSGKEVVEPTNAISGAEESAPGAIGTGSDASTLALGGVK